jgi:hypothetical protein
MQFRGDALDKATAAARLKTYFADFLSDTQRVTAKRDRHTRGPAATDVASPVPAFTS